MTPVVLAAEVDHRIKQYTANGQPYWAHGGDFGDTPNDLKFVCDGSFEEAITDDYDGMTVAVAKRPISQVVIGNKAYPLCNSAVRGVWSDAERKGRNFYTKPHLRLIKSLNAIYIPVRESPVVQCQGIWKAEARDFGAFDSDGFCMNPDLLLANGIPIDHPKLGTVGYRSVLAPSEFYGGEVELIGPGDVLVKRDWLTRLEACLDFPFRENEVGFAAWKQWKHWEHILGVPGHYGVHWDFDDNGIVDGSDRQTLIENVGRAVRPNYYSAAYFGNDWLSTGLLLATEMKESVPVICAWTQGGGYDAASGKIRLFDTPGLNERVYVEYHYDAPAEHRMNNILTRSRHIPVQN